MKHETLDRVAIGGLDMEHWAMKDWRLNNGRLVIGQWKMEDPTTWKMKSFPLGTASVALRLPWFWQYSYGE